VKYISVLYGNNYFSVYLLNNVVFSFDIFLRSFSIGNEFISRVKERAGGSHMIKSALYVQIKHLI